MPSARYSCAGSPPMLAKREHRQRGLVRQRRGGRPARRRRAVENHPERPHRADDVLELSLAQVLEAAAELVAAAADPQNLWRRATNGLIPGRCGTDRGSSLMS